MARGRSTATVRSLDDVDEDEEEDEEEDETEAMDSAYCSREGVVDPDDALSSIFAQK